MQLVLISTILYKILSVHNNIFKHIALLVIAYLVSQVLTNYTTISDIYGGGGKIFGGTYFFVFILGMTFYFYMDKISKKLQVIGLVISLCLLAIYEIVGELDKGFVNPPNDHTIAYSFIVFTILFGLYNLFGKFIRYLHIETLGRYSLYIFFYHLLFIDVYFKYLHSWIPSNGNLQYIVLILWGSILPILAVTIFRIVKNYLLKNEFIFNNSKAKLTIESKTTRR
jgi:peptidoglycan/LPS O-acetylase OafA/YrhL